MPTSDRPPLPRRASTALTLALAVLLLLVAAPPEASAATAIIKGT